MQHEEERITRDKQAKAKQMLLDVETSNNMSKTMKDLQKQKDKDEDLAIMRYVQSKQKAEYEKQETERMIKDEKEKELQKLREMQEKAADRQSEIDALRAKRAYEQQERQARTIEKLNLEKRSRLLAELDEARYKQYHEKESHYAQAADVEKTEFLRVI